MKKQLILSSLVALSAVNYAQNTFPSSGNAGIGTLSPSFKLDIVGAYADDGIRVTQGGSGGAAVHLNNTTTGGHRYGVFSYGAPTVYSGDFGIYDYTASAFRLHILGSNGNVGVGTTSPAYKVDAFTNTTNGALHGESNAAVNAYGVVGDANSPYATVGGDAVGVFGRASGNHSNYGGKFFATGDAPTCAQTSFGMYAAVFSPCANDYAGYFSGNMRVNGNAYCTSSAWSSDQKLKKDIKPLANGLEKISQLKPSTYLFKTEEFKGMNLPKEQQLGLIAQELEQVFPELVTVMAAVSETDKDGKVSHTIPEHKVVNYIGLIPVLIAGMQEQQSLIAAQQKQIEKLLAKESTATGIGQASGNAVNGFALEQNVPNPFSQETVIGYTLPETVSNASLVIYDLTGKQISTFALTGKGNSSITLTSEQLSAGIYIYSVLADGRILDSKRMVVAQK